MSFTPLKVLLIHQSFCYKPLGKNSPPVIQLDIPDLQPASWRHNALESHYDCELIGRIPSSLYSLTFIDRCGRHVNDVVHQAIDPMYFRPDSDNHSPLSSPPDFIVMGHHGRKGPKEHKAHIGTTADNALR